MPFSKEYQEAKRVLDTLIELNKNIVEEQYRELVLIHQPATRVYEWFYKN